MLLPNSQRAIVEQQKIEAYLLNESHPDNGGKAAFFLSLGFNRQEWQRLAQALMEIAMTCSVTKTLESAHGTKYIVDGMIHATSERTARVRTIWIVDGLVPDMPRLVTAYPGQG